MSLTWVRETLQTVISQLRDTQALTGCDQGSVDRLCGVAERVLADDLDEVDNEVLDKLIRHAHISMASKGVNNLAWRRFYTEACILRALAALIRFRPSTNSALAIDAIGWLDHAIVVSGAPGEGRLEFVYDLIERVQAECLPARSYSVVHANTVTPCTSPELDSASQPVLRLTTEPSISAFIKDISQRPFILSGFVRDWPALNERPWYSAEYLRFIAGPGRVVPVEVGKDYRDEDWTQQIMPWDNFLDALSLSGNPQGKEERPLLYLAQHDLLKQFPRLRDDIIVPDYVYASLAPPADFPDYKPPQNDDQLVINAWLGPAGTISPAHTDPFFNFYAQVVGRKTIWLAPPYMKASMYPYVSTQDISQPHNPAANNANPSMSNTSKVDVLRTLDQDRVDPFPLFRQEVVPQAMYAILEPGDLLFIPAGWWHAMRSEETSFSVSMWF